MHLLQLQLMVHLLSVLLLLGPPQLLLPVHVPLMLLLQTHQLESEAQSGSPSRLPLRPRLGIHQRLHGLGPLRIDLIGVTSIFGDDSSRWLDASHNDGNDARDVRLRVALQHRDHASAQRLVREVTGETNERRLMLRIVQAIGGLVYPLLIGSFIGQAAGFQFTEERVKKEHVSICVENLLGSEDLQKGSIR